MTVATTMSSEEVDLKEVQRELSKVIDPEIGVPIVEMNLIDKLDIQGRQRRHLLSRYDALLPADLRAEDLTGHEDGSGEGQGCQERQGHGQRALPGGRGQQTGKQAPRSACTSAGTAVDASRPHPCPPIRS